MAEPDSAILALLKSRSIGATYNLILEQAAALPELEALVFVHEDAEIIDGAFTAKLRDALRDPQVAIVGAVGATGTQDIAWWDGTLVSGSIPYAADQAPEARLTWPREVQRPPAAGVAVDTLYGVILALSPWAVRNLRFDESLQSTYAYDFDLCAQARARGRTVLAADLAFVHHRVPDVVSDEAAFLSAHQQVAEKWDDAELTEDQWRVRARAAEADAAAAGLLAASVTLQADATAAAQKRHLDALRATASWRMTEPLRRGNALAREMRRRWRSRGD